MLHYISWTTYFSVMGLLLLTYYIIIGITCYAPELKNLIGKSRVFLSSPMYEVNAANGIEPGMEAQYVQAELFPSGLEHNSPEEKSNVVQEHVSELTRDIRGVIARAAEQNFVREEFFLSLQLLCKRYSFQKGSPALEAIDNLIVSECEKYGYIQLSAEERVMLWNE